MKKQDLKDGMILETRNGYRHLLTNGVMRDFEGYILLKDYSEDLRLIGFKNLDIVKVYTDTKAFSLKIILDDEYLTLIWERKELKLTNRETEVLKALKTLNFNWIARDRSGKLYAFLSKPVKRLSMGLWVDGGSYFNIKNDDITLDSIKWEDKEPTKIDDLLKTS